RRSDSLLAERRRSMLTEPTLEKLKALRLDAFAAAWLTQQQDPALTAVPFDERLGLLVEAEWLARENRRLANALREAKLRLSQALTLAHADGGYIRLLARFARVDVLVLDDFALGPLPDHGRRDLLEILEDRTGERSTIITSQLPPAKWHEYVADPTLADALCDRLLHPAHRIALKGPSRRKEATPDSLT